MKTPRNGILALSLDLGIALASGCALDMPEDQFGSEVQESHAWANYHWASQTSPFTLKLGDNVDSTWAPSLSLANSDWSASSVLDTQIVSGGTRPKSCRATAGRVEVCNENYRNSGWLGIAQIWVSGNHITQGVVKLNDYYHNNAPYNTSRWRNLVMCQEIGHTFGLGHQDENFDNQPLGTCMDYSANPGPADEHPDQHDYQQLEDIYDHTDSTTTVGVVLPPGNASFNTPASWGDPIEGDPHHSDTFVRDLGDGHRVITHVLWVP